MQRLVAAFVDCQQLLAIQKATSNAALDRNHLSIRRITFFIAVSAVVRTMREEFRIQMYAKEGDPTCTAILMKWSEKVDVNSASYMKAHESMGENFPKFKEEFLNSNVSLQTKDKNNNKSYQKCWRHHVKKAFESISQQPKVHQATKLGDRSVLNGTTSPSIGVSLCTIGPPYVVGTGDDTTRRDVDLTLHSVAKYRDTQHCILHDELGDAIHRCGSDRHPRGPGWIHWTYHDGTDFVILSFGCIAHLEKVSNGFPHTHTMR